MALVVSANSKEADAAALAACSRCTATQFTRNSTTTMVRMIPKFTYSFLPIVMPFLLRGPASLPRLKLEVNHAGAFYGRGFKAPLPGGIQSRVCQHRVSAHNPGIFHRTVW